MEDATPGATSPEAGPAPATDDAVDQNGEAQAGAAETPAIVPQSDLDAVRSAMERQLDKAKAEAAALRRQMQQKELEALPDDDPQKVLLLAQQLADDTLASENWRQELIREAGLKADDERIDYDATTFEAFELSVRKAQLEETEKAAKAAEREAKDQQKRIPDLVAAAVADQLKERGLIQADGGQPAGSPNMDWSKADRADWQRKLEEIKGTARG